MLINNTSLGLVSPGFLIPEQSLANPWLLCLPVVTHDSFAYTGH